MPGETITLQVGQCGNQVGLQYWQQLASEHGINSDGSSTTYPASNINNNNNNNFQFQDLTNTSNVQEGTMASETKYRDDHPELFFTLSDSNTYTPRSVLIDMEPSVIAKSTSTLPMFNPRNVHLSEQGNGAANNWINGYKYGTEEEEALINLIDREADKCNNLSNFQLFHSVAGGTGSGVGSKVLELISDRYGHKKLLNTFSIFPSNEDTSDVVVQPYNTILTLKRLIDYSDATFIFHNDSLNRIENLLFHNTNNNNNVQWHNNDDLFRGTNKLIANVTASLSNPLRFPGYMYSSIESIISSLVPTPDLKFLTSAIAPFSSQKHNYINEYDMILELSNDRYKTNRVNNDTNYITMLNYLIGDNLDQREIRKGILKSQQRTQFVPWTARSVQVVHGKKSPFIKSKTNLDGVQITNNTSIIDVFNKILKQYDLLIKRKAYLNRYYNSLEEENEVIELFGQSREAVKSVVDEYKACREVSYLDDDDEDDYGGGDGLIDEDGDDIATQVQDPDQDMEI